MKLLLSASMIAVGMLAAAPLAPAHAATYRHPITHGRVYSQYPVGPAYRPGYRAYGYAYHGYPGHESYREKMIKTPMGPASGD